MRRAPTGFTYGELELWSIDRKNGVWLQEVYPRMRDDRQD